MSPETIDADFTVNKAEPFADRPGNGKSSYAKYKTKGQFFKTKDGGFFKSTGKVLGKATKATSKGFKRAGKVVYGDATKKYRKEDVSGLSNEELREKIERRNLEGVFTGPKKGPVTRFNNATKAHRQRIIDKQKYRTEVLSQKTSQYQYKQQLPKRENRNRFGNIDKSRGGPLSDKGKQAKITGKNLTGGFYSRGGRGGPLSDHKAKPKVNPITGPGGFMGNADKSQEKKGGFFS